MPCLSRRATPRRTSSPTSPRRTSATMRPSPPSRFPPPPPFTHTRDLLPIKIARKTDTSARACTHPRPPPPHSFASLPRTGCMAHRDAGRICGVKPRQMGFVRCAKRCETAPDGIRTLRQTMRNRAGWGRSDAEPDRTRAIRPASRGDARRRRDTKPRGLSDAGTAVRVVCQKAAQAREPQRDQRRRDHRRPQEGESGRREGCSLALRRGWRGGWQSWQRHVIVVASHDDKPLPRRPVVTVVCHHGPMSRHAAAVTRS